MKNIINTIIILAVVVFTSISYAQNTIDITCDKLPIEKINTLESEKECFLVEGYVYYEYKCPPCPKGARCKPCASNHIYITVNKDRKLNTRYDTSKDLQIFTQKYRHFKIGKRYTFSLRRLLHKGSTHYGTDQYNNELIGYLSQEDE